MNYYERIKYRLSLVQSSLNRYPKLKDKIVPYTWTLRDAKTNQLLVEYVVAGRTTLEAKLVGKLYFTVDPTIPNHEKNRYIEEDFLDRIVLVSPMW